MRRLSKRSRNFEARAMSLRRKRSSNSYANRFDRSRTRAPTPISSRVPIAVGRSWSAW